METQQLPKPQRLYSLDALRGFDMIWIMGLGYIIKDYSAAQDSTFWNVINIQFEHGIWDGFVFWDLIFPLFMFMAGVSTIYSIGRDLEKGSTKRELLFKVIKRGLILILIGVVYNNGLQLRPISDIRFPSVLGKIGATYMFANIIFLYANKRMQWVWFWGLLIGYWLLLKFTSAPGFPLGDLTEPGNFASYIDRSVLPGKLSRGIHDTVGLVCTIPGICNVLLGIFAGIFLKSDKMTPTGKAKWLGIAGIISIGLALLWNLDFPFNKNLWSSSFVLITGGISLLLLSIFYYIIDVRGYKRWSFFFMIIGMNSILIYISPIFIDWGYTTNGLFKWLGQLVGEPYDKVILGFCSLLVQWLFLYFLYKKRAFFRV
ncbi:MAG: DUF5009 domain-containing protein [Ginsengibacter sp.]